MKARIQRLRAEIGSDWRAAFEEQVSELEGIDLSSPGASDGDVARAAVALHHGYGDEAREQHSSRR